MDLEKLRSFCLTFPHATEDVQWEDDLLFRVGGKMFTVVNLNPPHNFSLKCTPDSFAELTQMEGIIPAPYMARNHWIQIRDHNALKFSEIQKLIGDSYRMVFEKLPLKVRKEMESLPKKRGGRKGRPGRHQELS